MSKHARVAARVATWVAMWVTMWVAPPIIAVAAPFPLHGQQASGRLTGVVTDDQQAPVAGAQITLVGTALTTVSEFDGRYRLGNVPAGSYDMRVQRIGQQPKVVNIVVRSGEETVANVSLASSAVSIGSVVISASRRVEKLTEAPATITSVGTDVLDRTVGNGFANALKEAKGVDFIQVGMTSIAINARGFNSSFNNRFLMVEDGRIAVLPENGLPVGQFTPTPKVDLAGMEVLVGPGSALYGPDASSGVLSLRTKDPKQFPGFTLEVTGGSRSYKDIQARYAGVAGNVGYKVSGEYQDANDWENYLCYNSGGSIVARPGVRPTCATGEVREDGMKAPIDWTARVARGTGAVVYYMGQNRLEVNAGLSRTDGVGQTNVGRNQLAGWGYNIQQLRYTTPHWYLNAYRAQSQSGTSFALNRFAGAQLTPANSTLSTDSLRMLSDWPSDGRMYAAEVQGNYQIQPLLNTRLIFGAQYRNDVVSSDRQWLTDRITGKDIANDQTGVYAQSTTSPVRWLDIVLAGRLDKPNVYDQQWSPKAGVVVKPVNDQAFRVTFNRAFKSPTILQTNFFIPDWTSIISIYGNTTGFKTVDATGAVKSSYSPMVPESNKTWEFGYKGVIANRLLLDGTYYRSDYKNFMSPLTIVGNPFATAAAGGPTFAMPTVNPGNDIPVNAQGRIVNQAGITPITLIYYNLGDAKVSGVDLGANLIASRHVEIRANLSTVGIDELTTPTGAAPEATSLNAPSTKWSLGVNANDIGRFSFGTTFRNVVGYYFRSGSNAGVIPTFGTLDANVSVRLPTTQKALLNVGVANLFSCTGQDVRYEAVSTTYPQPNQRIASEDRKCGFNRRHVEMINMPEIGTMVFVGIRYTR